MLIGLFTPRVESLIKHITEEKIEEGIKVNGKLI